jgi:hypothetical protein
MPPTVEDAVAEDAYNAFIKAAELKGMKAWADTPENIKKGWRAAVLAAENWGKPPPGEPEIIVEPPPKRYTMVVTTVEPALYEVGANEIDAKMHEIAMRYDMSPAALAFDRLVTVFEGKPVPLTITNASVRF